MEAAMNEKKFERVWRGSESVKEVCQKLKITEQSAYYWARKLGLPTFCGIDNETTPTQEEIAERSAEVRAKWSPAEERRRCAGAGRVSYGIPSYATARTTGSKFPVFVSDQ
jgi:hypothetical protein